MSEPRSAEIIPFPVRASMAERSLPREPDRLGKALAALDGALTAQRRAIGDWCTALSDLREATRGLGESVQTYRDGLDALGTRVTALRSKAAELASRADAACVPRADRAFPRWIEGELGRSSVQP